MASKPINLADVKFTTVLPEQKTSGYGPNERMSFTLDSAELPYIDGKQSYLLVEIESTSKWTSGNAASTAAPPVCLMPHLGVQGLFERATLRSQNGQELEDLDQCNLMSALVNGYCYDFDEYETRAKVEGVAAHTPRVENRASSDHKVNSFVPPGFDDVANTTIVGGGVSVTQQFVYKLPFGLMSAMQNQHEVYPNASLNGSVMEFYTAPANRVLAVQSGALSVDTLGDGVTATGFETYNYQDLFADIRLDDISDGDPLDSVFVQVGDLHTTCSEFSQRGVPYRAGQEVQVSYTYGSNTVTNQTNQISSVLYDEGAGLEQLNIGLVNALTKGDSTGDIEDVTLNVAPITLNYNISKCELRVLETVPSDPKAIDKAVQKGINYPTYTLTKQSMPAGLKNQVVNIPSSVTRCKSILVAHNLANDLDAQNDNNSLVYPQLEDALAGGLSYQFQVRNHLIPNRQVAITYDTETVSDNSIFYLELEKAFRPLKNLKALNDGLPHNARHYSKGVDSNHFKPDLLLPLCYPLLIAPMSSTYNLVDSEPQLRIENSSAGDVGARLYHIFLNHVRRVSREGDNLVVSI